MKCFWNGLWATFQHNLKITAAAKACQIPRKILERRFKKNIAKKGGMMPTSFFGEENEKKLAIHINVMQTKGFALTIDVWKVAYLLTEEVNLEHSFKKETERAGYYFVKLFLGRHLDIAIGKSECISLARSTAMNKQETVAYFKVLETVLMVDDVMLEPSYLFNMD